MTLTDVKNHLEGLDVIDFVLPNGTVVPPHFHVTEIGLINRKFIDCGGTVRDESFINFQLWFDDLDYEHRLSATKLRKIIQLSENVLGLNENLPVEVEYQGETIGRYDLVFDKGVFSLMPKTTDCLAKDKCGIPAQKPRVILSELQNTKCTPGGGCC